MWRGALGILCLMVLTSCSHESVKLARLDDQVLISTIIEVRFLTHLPNMNTGDLIDIFTALVSAFALAATIFAANRIYKIYYFQNLRPRLRIRSVDVDIDPEVMGRHKCNLKIDILNYGADTAIFSYSGIYVDVCKLLPPHPVTPGVNNFIKNEINELKSGDRKEFLLNDFKYTKHSCGDDVYVWGFISYYDRYNNIRHHDFCYKYDPVKNRYCPYDDDDYVFVP